jgi:hypothetical protein
MQLAGPGDDVLGLLGLIGVPIESRARLDLEEIVVDWSAPRPPEETKAPRQWTESSLSPWICASGRSNVATGSIPSLSRSAGWILSFRHDNRHGERRVMHHVPDDR